MTPLPRIASVFAWVCAASAGTGIALAQAGGAPAGKADDRVAEAGGKAFTRSDLVERLLYSEGPKLLDAMIELELARQMAAERGITASDADMERYIYEMLRQKLKDKTGLGELSPEQVRDLARAAAAQRGETWMSAEMTLRRQYFLDRIARRKVAVTEDELKREFVKRYGERITMRCIALQNQSDSAAVRKQLEAGADFAEAAKKVSLDAVTAARGGLCEPVGRNALPKAVEDEVFALKDGQLSRPVYYPLDGRFYLFQMVSRTPASKATMEQVRAELQAVVEQEKVKLGMDELARELKERKRKVVYLDERLKPKEGR